MSKSLTGIINNRKSVSGLNSMNVYDVSVEGIMKTPNIDNVDTTIQNIETQQNTNTTNISVNSSNISSNTLGISENSSNFINLNTRMNDAETDISNLTTDVNNNSSAINTNQSDINELQIITGDMSVNAGDFVMDVSNGNSIEFKVNTSNQLLIDNTGIIVGNDIGCNTDSTCNIGISSFRFNDGYFNNLDLSQTLTTRSTIDDSSIDTDNIGTTTNCDTFRKQITFDTGLRTMYIGQIYESGNTSNARFAIAINGGGGADPNIAFIIYC